INIDSFQEMNQYHVDTFVRLFHDVVRIGGLIYLSNSRDYRFTGKFSYPKEWKCLYMRRSPRSWTRHHPTEIFERTNDDASRAHQMQEAGYMADLTLAEALNPDVVKLHANLRAVVPVTPVECTVRWTNPAN